ncbi:hypothetical protein RIF23_07705 [Lipingzhangella sp. LS1_29]|uniref:Uncharacterized protein n=1 Tax=Lipingzhangella rawalii TaxID=2055835 RepID=A0ABU2H4E3_9ACTN|nr:hypothetical protein [Lipingzhangella rawalii]MDS1270177.1 hypothetical protein [Lipingzhangella rawalii]
MPDYLENFGEFTRETAKDWAVVQFLQNEFGMTLEQINSLER